MSGFDDHNNRVPGGIKERVKVTKGKDGAAWLVEALEKPPGKKPKKNISDMDEDEKAFTHRKCLIASKDVPHFVRLAMEGRTERTFVATWSSLRNNFVLGRAL